MIRRSFSGKRDKDMADGPISGGASRSGPSPILATGIVALALVTGGVIANDVYSIEIVIWESAAAAVLTPLAVITYKSSRWGGVVVGITPLPLGFVLTGLFTS